MWIIFRHTKSEFQNLDKHVYDVVEDADILTFQDHLGEGKKSDINLSVYFLQEYFESNRGIRYYARQYVPFTTLQRGTTPRAEQRIPDTHPISKSPVWVLRNPCNIAR